MKKYIFIILGIIVFLFFASRFLSRPFMHIQFVDGEAVLKSTVIIEKGVTKTSRFNSIVPDNHVSQMGIDCLYLDNEEIKNQFNEILSLATENGTLSEYISSPAEIIAHGTLEKRVYDYGECPICPPQMMCDPGFCGDHESECINPTKLEVINLDGNKYGTNWFYGYIITEHPYSRTSGNEAYLKDENGNFIKSYECNMHLNNGYKANHIQGITALAFASEDMQITENILDTDQKFKIYGNKTRAYFKNYDYCIYDNQDQCFTYRELIIVERIINENNEDLITITPKE